MTENHLHIVCLDVPYPVDYGGVFDLFYKIKSLSEAGVKINLHCFSYGRPPAPELNQWCEQVHYYERGTPLSSFTKKLPYIVSSRANPELLANLKKDNYPILMEGIHCTYFVQSGDLPKERCFVRLHNVEHRYYHQLWETSSSFFKKLYFERESKLLYEYEKDLGNKATFWTVCEHDLQVFHEELGYPGVDYLPLFMPEYRPEYDGRMGSFCLYHGNLSVPENEYAATWLLENIFADLEIPFVVAGKNPSPKLEKLAHKNMHTCLVANPLEKEMQEMIRMAQVNILPSFNNTGIKLKLVNALYMGKHCIVNNAGVEGTGLEGCCTIANTTADMKAAVAAKFETPFEESDFNNRVGTLNHLFDNRKNASQMINWIFNGEPTRPGLRPR